jgi:hypothetical protein
MLDNLTEEDFEKPDPAKKKEGGVFGKRGIEPEVAEGAFARYLSGDPDGTIDRWLYVGPPDNAKQVEKRYKTAVQRSLRAPGLYMRRFPVPEADPFLYAELRPDWPIWSGEWPKASTHNRHDFPTMDALEKHVADAKVTREMVVKGCTPAELARFRESFGAAWEVTGGADHDGQELDRRQRHVHLNIPRYLFVGNQKVQIDFEHDHSQDPRWEMWGGFRTVESHLRQEHRNPSTTYNPKRLSKDERRTWEPFTRTSLVTDRKIPFTTWDAKRVPVPEKRHEHHLVRDDTRYAQRLSSHPTGFARVDEADRVFWVLEGSLKEAAVVTAGEATFSSPSVSLWEAPELGRFARAHLLGRAVYVVCDSDWEPGVGKRRPDDDSVLRQTLSARDALRNYGVADAHACAPPPGPGGAKRGVDDHLAAGRTMDELVVFDRVPQMEPADWIEARDPRQADGRRVRDEAWRNATAVLRWLSTHADAEGRSRVAVRTLGARLRAQHEIEATSDQAAAQKVSRTLANLESWGAVSRHDLKKRRGQQLRKGKPWVGDVQILPDELRSLTVKTRTG